MLRAGAATFSSRRRRRRRFHRRDPGSDLRDRTLLRGSGRCAVARPPHARVCSCHPRRLRRDRSAEQAIACSRISTTCHPFAFVQFPVSVYDRVASAPRRRRRRQGILDVAAIRAPRGFDVVAARLPRPFSTSIPPARSGSGRLAHAGVAGSTCSALRERSTLQPCVTLSTVDTALKRSISAPWLLDQPLDFALLSTPHVLRDEIGRRTSPFARSYVARRIEFCADSAAPDA